MALPESDSAGAGPAVSSRHANLRRLLQPRHVAFIGGDEAAEALRQCLAIGFQGQVWAVHPSRATLGEQPCYRAVDDLPEAPDAAFVAVPREATVAVVRDLAARGAGGAVCYAAGFAEQGGEGKRLQEQLIAAAGDLAVVGPNCYGLLNYLDGAALWPDVHGGHRVERGVALVTQSGNIGINLTMQGRSLPIGYMISVGNQACLGLEDCVAALIEDPRLTAIGLYIEGLTDIPGFARAAARALEKGVPLVALKTGNSEIGARIALSHTSSLAGSEALYEALFRRLGVVRVHSLASLLETLKLFAVTGALPGRRLAAMSCSGGEASLVADLAAKLGLIFPEIGEAQRTKLRAALPAFVTISNPFDYNTSVWGDAAAQEDCFTTILEGDIDAALLVLDFPHAGLPGVTDWYVTLDAFIAAQRRTGIRGIVVSTLGELLPADARARAMVGGVTPLQGLDEALPAIEAAAWYGERRAAVNPEAAGQLLLHGSTGPGCEPCMLDEWDSKQRLAAAGLTVPEGRAVSAAEAPTAARALGFPVAVKALDARLAHKTEAGAVALGLKSGAEVAEAVSRIAAGPLTPQRFLVERMVEGCVTELILGIKRDPQFGLALVVGAGGVQVELAGDSCILLLPCTEQEREAALDSLKVSRLIAGFRGRPAGDRAAILEAMRVIAAFAEMEGTRLVELDVNPLMVLPRGNGVVAADALIRLEG